MRPSRGLDKFEGPDPAYWCAQGYAICNPDILGVAESEGDSVLWESILRYRGSDGRLRVSLRHLDEALSTDDVPGHTFDRTEKLAAGEIVEVEIDLLPVASSSTLVNSSASSSAACSVR
ncbi:hypothetical protein ACFXBB_37840 [Streptomyces scopuliridis]|uniref:hypothetical protein n=1 Tax=Streptomyces scopuliridis TaxID=452529 RepID=UPI0036A3500E